MLSQRSASKSFLIRLNAPHDFVSSGAFSAWDAIFSPVLVVITSDLWLEYQVVFCFISFISFINLQVGTPWVIDLNVLALFVDDLSTSSSTIDRTDL